MSALSKIEALTALASGKSVAYTFQNVETVLDKTWSIDNILTLQCDLYIKIETVSIAGMTFLKPFCLEELTDGQEVFVIENTNWVTVLPFDSSDPRLVENAKAGFLQRDRENASKQIEAIQKALGFKNTIHLQKGYPAKEELETKKRASKKKAEPEPAQTVKPPNEESTDLPWETNPPEVVETHKSNSRPADDIRGSVCNLNDAPPKEEVKQPEITEDDCSNEAFIQKANEDQYQKLLAELIERAQKAGSPKEANALYKYTTQWTEEQRKPLMSAITKRLNELNAEAKPAEQPPSLMVLIQTAPDLAALDALEIDVSGRHPDIQPKLMGYVKARRFELENGATQ